MWPLIASVVGGALQPSSVKAPMGFQPAPETSPAVIAAIALGALGLAGGVIYFVLRERR